MLLLVIVCRLVDIPSTLFVHGNASATANNIAAHETLFRLGIVGQLFCGTILIFVVLALYRLFEGVDQYLAVLVVILGGVLPAAIGFFIVLNDAAALILVRGADFLSVFDKPQREALAMGVGLIVNGLGYLANSFTGLLLPHYANTVAKLTFPTLTGEVAFVLWLLIRGVKSGMPSKSAGVSFNAVPLEQSSEKGSY